MTADTVTDRETTPENASTIGAWSTSLLRRNPANGWLPRADLPIVQRCVCFAAAAGRATDRAISSEQVELLSSEPRITAWT
jgi:hypothetical protein